MRLDPAHKHIDLYTVWLETNGAKRCHRLNATITPATCLTNLYKSERKSSDLRCAGCGGLDNQPDPGRSFLPPVIVEVPKLDESLNDGLAVLEKIIDQHFENPAAADDFNDLELELDDDALLALFPELYKGDCDEEYFPAFREYQAPMPHYAVYKGRCKKCGGYVDNIREEHDDNVFRCLACGWRTSPEYELNRLLIAAGKDGQGNRDVSQFFTV